MSATAPPNGIVQGYPGSPEWFASLQQLYGLGPTQQPAGAPPAGYATSPWGGFMTATQPNYLNAFLDGTQPIGAPPAWQTPQGLPGGLDQQALDGMRANTPPSTPEEQAAQQARFAAMQQALQTPMATMPATQVTNPDGTITITQGDRTFTTDPTKFTSAGLYQDASTPPGGDFLGRWLDSVKLGPAPPGGVGLPAPPGSGSVDPLGPAPPGGVGMAAQPGTGSVDPLGPAPPGGPVPMPGLFPSQPGTPRPGATGGIGMTGPRGSGSMDPIGGAPGQPWSGTPPDWASIYGASPGGNNRAIFQDALANNAYNDPAGYDDAYARMIDSMADPNSQYAQWMGDQFNWMKSQYAGASEGGNQNLRWTDFLTGAAPPRVDTEDTNARQTPNMRDTLTQRYLSLPSWQQGKRAGLNSFTGPTLGGYGGG